MHEFIGSFPAKISLAKAGEIKVKTGGKAFTLLFIKIYLTIKRRGDTLLP